VIFLGVVITGGLVLHSVWTVEAREALSLRLMVTVAVLGVGGVILGMLSNFLFKAGDKK